MVASRYEDFLCRHQNLHILFLEIDVGYNTPGIIKYLFWQMMYQNPEAVYACVNLDKADVPQELAVGTVRAYLSAHTEISAVFTIRF